MTLLSCHWDVVASDEEGVAVAWLCATCWYIWQVMPHRTGEDPPICPLSHYRLQAITHAQPPEPSGDTHGSTANHV